MILLRFRKNNFIKNEIFGKNLGYLAGEPMVKMNAARISRESFSAPRIRSGMEHPTMPSRRTGTRAFLGSRALFGMFALCSAFACTAKTPHPDSAGSDSDSGIRDTSAETGRIDSADTADSGIVLKVPKKSDWPMVGGRYAAATNNTVIEDSNFDPTNLVPVYFAVDDLAMSFAPTGVRLPATTPNGDGSIYMFIGGETGASLLVNGIQTDHLEMGGKVIAPPIFNRGINRGIVASALEGDSKILVFEIIDDHFNPIWSMPIKATVFGRAVFVDYKNGDATMQHFFVVPSDGNTIYSFDATKDSAKEALIWQQPGHSSFYAGVAAYADAYTNAACAMARLHGLECYDLLTGTLLGELPFAADKSSYVSPAIDHTIDGNYYVYYGNHCNRSAEINPGECGANFGAVSVATLPDMTPVCSLDNAVLQMRSGFAIGEGKEENLVYFMDGETGEVFAMYQPTTDDPTCRIKWQRIYTTSITETADTTPVYVSVENGPTNLLAFLSEEQTPGMEGAYLNFADPDNGDLIISYPIRDRTGLFPTSGKAAPSISVANLSLDPENPNWCFMTTIMSREMLGICQRELDFSI